MLRKLLQKVEITPNIVKQIVYMFVIGLLYFVLGLINFTSLEFESERLLDRNYWIQYSLIIGFALVIMFLAMSMKKDKLKINTVILDLYEILRSLKESLTANLMYDKFSDYLVKEDKEEKLKAYRVYLEKKKCEQKKREKIDKYEMLLKETYKEDFDIDKISKVHILETTTNTIFGGLRNTSKKDKVHYTGFEDITMWVAPALIVGMLFSAVMLTISLNKEQASLEQIKNLLTTLWVTITYLIRGLSYAEYSINTVYVTVLENRINKVKAFLTENNSVAFIEENTAYKYKVKIEKEAENGTKQQ